MNHAIVSCGAACRSLLLRATLAVVIIITLLPLGSAPAAQAQAQLPPVFYNRNTNVIYIGADYPSGSPFAAFPSHPDAIAAKQPITIPQLDRALATQYPDLPDALVDQGNGAWLLRADTVISRTARLDATNATISELRLDSSPGNRPAAPFLTRITSYGHLNIDGIRVNSWAGTGVDTNHTDGRSYLLAYQGGRMDIKNAEISYLGWAPGEPSGISWRQRGTRNDPRTGATGDILDSTVHHNYKGQYSFEAFGMRVLRNQFHSNISYGFDPHDFSEGFEVAFNTVYNNGNHGIIFSRGCVNNHIHNNTVFGNTGHGIMLDRGSDNNLVENNLVYNNRDGVVIFQSVGNVVRSNELRENQRGVRINASFIPGDEYDGISTNNTVANNTIQNNSEYGVYLYERADRNNIEGNTVIGNLRSGLYIKTGGNTIRGNSINTNGIGVSIIGTDVYTGGTVAALGAPGRDNVIQGNDIESNNGVGLQLRGGQGTLIGSRDGTNAAEANSIRSNGGHGVSLDATSANNIIAGNIIHANGQATPGDGVTSRGAGSLNNRVSRNSITANTRSGIRLSQGAANNLQPPIVTSAPNAPILTGTAAPNARIEIYRDPRGQGNLYLGAASADGGGNWRFQLPQNDDPNAGRISVIVLDASGNTSAFSGAGASGGTNYTIGAGRNGELTIFVSGQGSTVTLPDIERAVATISPTVRLIENQGNGVWQANASLFIGRGVTLNLTRDTVSWLKLRSQAGNITLAAEPASQFNYQSFTTLRVFNGTISIDGVRVTSWDPAANTFDTDVANGRSYILAKYEARLDIRNADLSYLGSADGESYGVSWRDTNEVDENGNPGPLRTRVTGEVLNSVFSHNYYGIYTYQATNMVFRGNKFHTNISYGFDPHDFTNNVLVEDNEAFDNGNHGFIISRACTNFVFRRNKSYHNRNPDETRLAHGFMLDPGSPNSENPQVPSTNNLLEDNEAWGNEGYGLRILGSTSNTVRNNIFRDNQIGITVEGPSTGNTISGNTLAGNSIHGIFVRGGADTTTVAQNRVSGNGGNGIYVKSNGNTIADNIVSENRRAGIAFLSESEPAPAPADFSAPGASLAAQPLILDQLDPVTVSAAGGNQVRANTVARNAEDGIEVKVASGAVIEANTVEQNNGHGIYLTDGASNNRLMKNTVRGNMGNGIRANGQDSRQNTWSENSVYANARGGIAVTGQANGGIRPPELKVQERQVRGRAQPGAVIELFSDSGFQARHFEGRVVAGADGNFSFTVSGIAPNIAATVTDPAGNSSALPRNPQENAIFLPIVRR